MVDYVCPQCRGPLSRTAGVPPVTGVSPVTGETPAVQAYRCPACPRDYPIRYGIPDFRLTPDPYISFDDEHAKAGRVVEAGKGRTFEELVRFYWQITPDVPADAVERYVRHVMDGEERGRAQFEFCRAGVPSPAGLRGGTSRPSSETSPVPGSAGGGTPALLETGCGTGGFLLAAARCGHEAVGVDIALRWLVIAKRRLESEGVEAQLVCASADRLPFPDGAFAMVTSAHALEHMEDAAGALSEAARVLSRGGRCHFITPNRYSLGPEPCVRVWGVGFLPRPLMAPYVRLVKRVPYRHIRLLSAFELGRMLRRSGLTTWSVSPAPLTRSELASLGPRARRLAGRYNQMLARSAFARAMTLFGPVLQITGRK